MELKELMTKISKFNDYINKSHENRTENERLTLKTMKIWEEVWEFYNEVLGSLWFTRAGKQHSREELENECADVILSTLLVASDLWIKIDEVLEKKLNKVFDRFNLND